MFVFTRYKHSAQPARFPVLPTGRNHNQVSGKGQPVVIRATGRNSYMTNDSTKKVTAQPREQIIPRPGVMAKLTKQGPRFAEVLYMDKGLPKPTIKKLDKNHYQVLKTGDVKEFKHHERKQKDDLKKTFMELRGIIRANFDGEGENQVFLTLTYDKNMTDPEKLMTDFKGFWQRLKYSMPKHKLEYVAVAEPQGNKSWHMHVMIKSDQPVLFIDQKDLTSYKPHPRLKGRLYKDPETGKPVITGGVWGHGYATCARLKGDDRGRYYEAYFTSMKTDGSFDNHEAGKKGSKKYKKGARLPLYPKYFKLYRCSFGIVKPNPELSTYPEIEKDYDLPFQSSSYDLVDETGQVLNSILRESRKVKPVELKHAEEYDEVFINDPSLTDEKYTRFKQENQPPKT